MLPFLLAHAREWWAAADALRVAGVPEGEPALTVWREAAWAHVLFSRGLYDAAVARLRWVFRAVTGVRPPVVTRPTAEADVVAVAAELFARLRAFVSARHLVAFRSPAAA